MPGFRAGSFNDLGRVVLAIALAIIAPVIAVILLNQLAPLFLNNLSEFVTNLTALSTGSAIGDAILSIAVIVIPIVGVIFLMTLALDAFKSRGGGGV